MKLLSIVTVGLAATGCITVTARVRGGPTVSTTGELGWEVGLAAGIGYSTSPTTSIRSLPAVSIGDRGAAFGTSLEVGTIDERFGWYAGLAAELATSEDAIARWAYGGALRPVWFARDQTSGEKSVLSLESRRALSIGVEAHAGLATTDADGSHGRFALLPVLDYTMTSAD